MGNREDDNLPLPEHVSDVIFSKAWPKVHPPNLKTTDMVHQGFPLNFSEITKDAVFETERYVRSGFGLQGSE
jgi:hypothetical protein